MKWLDKLYVKLPSAQFHEDQFRILHVLDEYTDKTAD